ncbi:MAG: hypothetical protein Q4C70_02145 [Planctomycetia bacterium]|nr:hypothetical protein [Planctomycetia bacterium]
MSENDLKSRLQKDARRLLNDAQNDAQRTETSVTRIMDAVREQSILSSSSVIPADKKRCFSVPMTHVALTLASIMLGVGIWTFQNNPNFQRSVLAWFQPKEKTPIHIVPSENPVMVSGKSPTLETLRTSPLAPVVNSHIHSVNEISTFLLPNCTLVQLSPEKTPDRVGSVSAIRPQEAITGVWEDTSSMMNASFVWIFEEEKE